MSWKRLCGAQLVAILLLAGVVGWNWWRTTPPSGKSAPAREFEIQGQVFDLENQEIVRIKAAVLDPDAARSKAAVDELVRIAAAKIKRLKNPDEPERPLPFWQLVRIGIFAYRPLVNALDEDLNALARSDFQNVLAYICVEDVRFTDLLRDSAAEMKTSNGRTSVTAALDIALKIRQSQAEKKAEKNAERKAERNEERS